MAAGKKPNLSTPASPSPKANKPKTPQPKKAEPAHPTYLQMCIEAILSLRERNGSSQYAIAKYLEEKYKGFLPPNFKKILSVQLKNLVKQNKLVKVKASYKLSEEIKKSVPKAAAPKVPKSPKALKGLKAPNESKPPKYAKAPKAPRPAKPPKKEKSVKDSKTPKSPKASKPVAPVSPKKVTTPKTVPSPKKPYTANVDTKSPNPAKRALRPPKSPAAKSPKAKAPKPKAPKSTPKKARKN